MTQVGENYTGTQGQEYFDQRQAVRSGRVQKRRSALFSDLGAETHVIVDFGCGTGGLLSSLVASTRIGVEISEHARKVAADVLDQVVAETASLEDNMADVAISHHAMEHVPNPNEVIGELGRILKPGGTLRIVVPCEMPVLIVRHRTWQQDMDQHLYTWTPLTLGNLIASNGFEIINAHISPKSTPGRLISVLAKIPGLGTKLLWLKSLKSGKVDTVVTAKKL